MAGNKMGNRTKQRILSTAKDMFAELGFENTKVDDIATKAGITKAMLYYHFGTKENIMTELVNSIIEEIEIEIDNKFKNNLIEDKEHLQSHIKNMCRFWITKKQSIKIIMSAAIQNPNHLFALSNSLSEFYNFLYKANGGKDKISKEAMLNLFFYNTLPMVFLPIFSTQVSDIYDLDIERIIDGFSLQFSNLLINTLK